MAWIEAHQDLRDHPKTKRAARLLGIDRPQMIGHLLCLWWWCLDYAEDGDLSDFDAADIADAAEWSGDPGAFVSALINCGPADRAGFIVDADGLRVNDWAQYGGKYVAKRNQGRDRQRTYRERNAASNLSDAEVTRHQGVSNTPREDKTTEEEITEDKTTEEEITQQQQPRPRARQNGNAAVAAADLKPDQNLALQLLLIAAPDFYNAPAFVRENHPKLVAHWARYVAKAPGTDGIENPAAFIRASVLAGASAPEAGKFDTWWWQALRTQAAIETARL